MNAWLATLVGDTAAPIVGFILLFLLVIALLLVVFAVLRRVTGGTFVAGGRNRQVRLSVTDAAAVDSRRRLVLVRRDDVEHLILIGGPSDVVIEQNIRQFAKQHPRVEPAAAEHEPKHTNGAPEVPRVQQPAAPAAAERAAPAAAPRPTPPAQAPAPRPAPAAQSQAPQIPLRSAQPHPVSPPRDLRLAEPPKHAQPPAPAPIPETGAQAAAAAAPAASAPVASPAAAAPVVAAVAATAAAQDTANGWQRTASPSFGTPRRSEPPVYMPALDREAPVEARTTTAAAFPFAVRNEGSPAAKETATATKEPALDILGPPEPVEPEVSLGDMDFEDAFDSTSEGELHIAPGNGEKPKKADSIEDEMERLLGDLSSPDKR
ncbi:flagellar biosynthetic protein FliO [Phyllobacterium lublinensis]|uniref:flagellar biosynthetic protein FliO n=1 Tax=Phyllobacterium lublinensis TaxID=2875708 RepID=UPI001CC9C519|nr:flagellar biosynthetic protein FliO [Phyllobacterium sp. 2063]MBZ9653361.1 flagellar biosynthetic protein FliO [Phyllobacterium sp. 2063]